MLQQARTTESKTNSALYYYTLLCVLEEPDSISVDRSLTVRNQTQNTPAAAWRGFSVNCLLSSEVKLTNQPIKIYPLQRRNTENKKKRSAAQRTPPLVAYTSPLAPCTRRQRRQWRQQQQKSGLYSPKGKIRSRATDSPSLSATSAAFFPIPGPTAPCT